MHIKLIGPAVMQLDDLIYDICGQRLGVLRGCQKFSKILHAARRATTIPERDHGVGREAAFRALDSRASVDRALEGNAARKEAIDELRIV